MEIVDLIKIKLRDFDEDYYECQRIRDEQDRLKQKTVVLGKMAQLQELMVETISKIEKLCPDQKPSEDL